MEDNFQAALDNCIFDICQTGVKGAICENGLQLAEQCMQEGYNVDGWRLIDDECSELNFTLL